MADEANCYVILALLEVSLFGKGNDERLGSFRWPLLCFLDFLTKYCEYCDQLIPYVLEQLSWNVVCSG